MEDKNDDLDALLERLRPFQREGFDFATKGADSRGRLLIADEMGLGKTVTSLAIMLAFKAEWPLLILCPASLRYTWPSEIEKFYPWMPHSDVYVVKGFDDCDFYSNPHKRERIKVVIATYSLLQNRSAAARVLQQFKFKCVIADESHNLKEKTSQRCQLALPLLMSAKRLLLLSGTPALARPVELWPQLHCIDQDLFGSYTSYTKTYCNARRGRFGWDVSGLSNADELHTKLKSVMIRRLKADVLKELPAKQRCIVPVTIQESKHVKECRDIISQLNETRSAVSSLVGEEASEANFEARSLLMQAYKASGIGKAQSVAEYVLDWLRGSGTQKVLVFAHHKGVLDTIEAAVSKHLKGVGHMRIDGSVPPAERAARVKKFQTKAQVRLALLSVTAAGVGLTLTAASTVIFAELHWTPGVLAQAEDRCHRIGQTNAVNIMYCVCKDADMSVDMSLWKMLGKKVSNLGRMIDGEKGASMNAKDSENSPPSEQELTSFFADNCPNDTENKKKAPAKGSIQSFFKKPSAAPSSKPQKLSTSMVKSCAVTPESSKVESLLYTSTIKNSTNSVIMSVSKQKPIETKSTWSCSMCTFSNQSKSAACVMCGASPPAQVTIKKNTVECGTCTYENKSTSSICTICKSILNLKDVKSFPSNQASIDVIAAPQSHQHNVTSNLSSSSTPVSSQEPEVIELLDCSDDEGLQPIPPKRQKIESIPRKNTADASRKDTKRPSLLCFSVSRNSGRIAIHEATTGESLSINFDLDQIVNEDTSEELLMRQLKRNGTTLPVSASPSQVTFEDSEVDKGKVSNDYYDKFSNHNIPPSSKSNGSCHTCSRTTIM
jgi:SWI/SNF-related matrix-associated actin-dependent regulator 1 of chromatin subfamily A